MDEGRIRHNDFLRSFEKHRNAVEELRPLLQAIANRCESKENRNPSNFAQIIVAFSAAFGVYVLAEILSTLNAILEALQ